MFECFNNSTVMITGATGLIGQSIVRRLLKLGASIVAVVRNTEKAKSLFGNDARITYIVSDVKCLAVNKMSIDYIIHAASITSSKDFVTDPINTINTAIEGTRRTLEIARHSSIKGYVYLSSMEVYGYPDSDEIIDELHNTNLNTMAVRSAYPESKRLCECLCASYANQHGVPAKVVRLTQTFGPGVRFDDGRVFAEFARCVLLGRDIILHTKGDTKRSYLYTDDAVDAILTVLQNGDIGEAYNAANENTYCSIYEMAQLVAKEFGDGKTKVIIEESDITLFGYVSTLHMNLSTAKLRTLGWHPTTDLLEMYRKMIDDIRKQQCLFN